MAKELTVGIAGLGAIGLHLARALDAGVEGLKLIAVAARDHAKARDNLADADGWRKKCAQYRAIQPVRTKNLSPETP